MICCSEIALGITNPNQLNTKIIPRTEWKETEMKKELTKKEPSHIGCEHAVVWFTSSKKLPVLGLSSALNSKANSHSTEI